MQSLIMRGRRAMHTTNDVATVDNIQVKKYEGTAGRILEMLGNGLAPNVVASALGVTDSYVSQLIGEESFSQQVAALRFTRLQEATSRDKRYDSLEDKLLEKMEDLLPMMYKPMEVLRALTLVNAAKRRGADAPDNTVIHNTVVQLTLPQVITQQFVKDIKGQVVAVGEQELITIDATQLTSKLKEMKNVSTGQVQAVISNG